MATSEINSEKVQKERLVRVAVVGVLVRDNKVLLNRRNKKEGKGMWGLPAGHLEFGEDLEECVVRECKEETGMDVAVERLVSVAPNKVYGNHYVVFAFLVVSLDPTQQPQLLEPENHQRWEWFDLDKLPDDLFVTAANALRDFKAGRIYYPKKSNQ